MGDLHEIGDLSWKEISAEAPTLPKGWFELAMLEESVRLEFIRDFWFNALPYLPHVYAFLDHFFATVSHLGVYVAQTDPFLVYTTENERFLGRPPLQEEQIDQIKKSTTFPLPEDYLQFLRIHDGFQREKEKGIFSTTQLFSERDLFVGKIEGIKIQDKVVDSQTLFPFYRLADSYQCFYSDWYPDGQVGNVFYSLSEGHNEQQSFYTFLDWFTDYLGGK